jgi:hypothetical protein
LFLCEQIKPANKQTKTCSKNKSFEIDDDILQSSANLNKLDETAKGYQMFDGKAEVHKVLLTP